MLAKPLNYRVQFAHCPPLSDSDDRPILWRQRLRQACQTTTRQATARLGTTKPKKSCRENLHFWPRKPQPNRLYPCSEAAFHNLRLPSNRRRQTISRCHRVAPIFPSTYARRFKRYGLFAFYANRFYRNRDSHSSPMAAKLGTFSSSKPDAPSGSNRSSPVTSPRLTNTSRR